MIFISKSFFPVSLHLRMWIVFRTIDENWKLGVQQEEVFFFFFLPGGRLIWLIGEGSGSPLQYSCLANPIDRGAWWATVHGSQRRTWLSDTHTHTHTMVDSQHINHYLSVEKPHARIWQIIRGQGVGDSTRGRQREEGEGAEPRVQMKLALFGLELAWGRAWR